MGVILLLPAAERDLEEIHEHTVNEWGAGQARRYVAGLMKTLDPESKSTCPGAPLRELNTKLVSRTEKELTCRISVERTASNILLASDSLRTMATRADESMGAPRRAGRRGRRRLRALPGA